MKFNAEEIQYLCSLPAVVKVSNGRIEYADDFKRECVRRYAQGDSPSRMFREAGLDPSLIGYKRIERCIARWKRAPQFKQFVDAYVSSNGDAAGTGVADDGYASVDGAVAVAGNGTVRIAPSRRRNYADTLSSGSSSDSSPAAPAAPGGDLRDLLIAQQIRRIAELESEIRILHTRLRIEPSGVARTPIDETVPATAPNVVKPVAVAPVIAAAPVIDESVAAPAADTPDSPPVNQSGDGTSE